MYPPHTPPQIQPAVPIYSTITCLRRSHHRRGQCHVVGHALRRRTWRLKQERQQRRWQALRPRRPWNERETLFLSKIKTCRRSRSFLSKIKAVLVLFVQVEEIRCTGTDQVIARDNTVKEMKLENSVKLGDHRIASWSDSP